MNGAKRETPANFFKGKISRITSETEEFLVRFLPEKPHRIDHKSSCVSKEPKPVFAFVYAS